MATHGKKKPKFKPEWKQEADALRKIVMSHVSHRVDMLKRIEALEQSVLKLTTLKPTPILSNE